MTVTVEGGASMTHAEYLDLFRERFGEKVTDWACVCPGCGDVATVGDLRAALFEHPRERNGNPVVATEIFGQECIGRTLGALGVRADQWKGRGCDWAAYGFIPGPLAVIMDDGRTSYSFHHASAPEAT